MRVLQWERNTPRPPPCSARFSLLFLAPAEHICCNRCREKKKKKKKGDTGIHSGVASAAGCSSLLVSGVCVCVCVCVCVRLCSWLMASSPSSLLVASLISAFTIWKQLVLSGRMPSALHEAAWRETVVLHTGRTDRHREELWGRVGGLFGGRLWIQLWKCKPLSLSWRSWSFLFSKH